MEKTDECKSCTLRGNLDECQKSDCHLHDSWYAQELSLTLKQKIEDKGVLRRMLLEDGKELNQKIEEIEQLKSKVAGLEATLVFERTQK